MYFLKIRNCFSWNNNPTMSQFKYALIQLVLRKLKSPSTANCVDVTNVNNTSEASKVDLQISEMLLSKTVWMSAVLYYISSYIIKNAGVFKMPRFCSVTTRAVIAQLIMATKDTFPFSHANTMKIYWFHLGEFVRSFNL